jgi:hypothetical protein
MTNANAPTQQSHWHTWNQQGLIPGPEETETAFAERVAFCQTLNEHLAQRLESQLPFHVNDQASESIREEVLPLTQELYGIAPRWVPLFFNNYQLAPWHGGCAWIFQLDEHTPTAAFLQLRANFRSSLTYLALYRRPELIAHEIAHVGRMLYQEPQFEEFFAYESSSSPWRRWFGPLVQSSTESLFFLLILGVVLMADFALVGFGHPHGIAASLVWWIRLIPVFLIVLAFGRLLYRHVILRQCRQKLEALYPDPRMARYLLYRLRDHEIHSFGRLSPSAIKNFMETATQTSFRWRFLRHLYPTA